VAGEKKEELVEIEIALHTGLLTSAGSYIDTGTRNGRSNGRRRAERGLATQRLKASKAKKKAAKNPSPKKKPAKK